MPPAGGLAQITGVFEGNLKKLQSLTVPGIPEIQALHESSKIILAAEISSLRDMQTGTSTGNPTAYAQAYDAFTGSTKQRAEIRQVVESLIAQYKITDDDVNYRFRNKQ